MLSPDRLAAREKAGAAKGDFSILIESPVVGELASTIGGVGANACIASLNKNVVASRP